jgi:hypothetical protein
MFLQTIPSLIPLNLSNLLERGVLKQYNAIASYELYRTKYAREQLSVEELYKLLNTFLKVLKGDFSNEILVLIRYYEKDSTKNFDRICYMTKDNKTEDIITDLLELLYYIQFCHENDKVMFSNIKCFLDNLKNKVHEEYNVLVDQGYNIFDEKSLNEVMQYFWKYELNIRFIGEK